MEDDDDDDFYWGTTLPELEEDELPRKRAVQDLTVRDEKGRQRFHGAFTGGFSAGFFNTVGSKEGWEPTNFISTRNSKASKHEQNPEDFMDEEDFGEFGIAPKKIHTTSQFTDTAQFPKKRGHPNRTETIIPGEPPLEDLIKPVIESIGISILKKMGWRLGQGIGPKVKKGKNIKVYGCSAGPLRPEEDDLMLSNFLFAPDDTPDVPYIPKDDFHGLGYTGLSTKSVLSNAPCDPFTTSTTKSFMEKEKRKLRISGQAFGIGALEDDDDEDVYSKDDMSQYDFSEFSHHEKDVHAMPSGSKCGDHFSGQILSGFILASKPAVSRKQYPLPQVPSNFVPSHQKITLSMKKQDEIASTAKQKLNPNVRSLLLGETAFVKPAEKKQDTPTTRHSRFDVTPEQMLTSKFVRVSKFKPFPTDEEKQNRYDEFVKRGCNKEWLKSVQPLSMTEWEKQQELDEFNKVSSFYQPLSKALSSRFESRCHLGMDPILLVSQKQKLVTEPCEKEKKIPVREVLDWHPVALLCKRFNVANPYPDSTYEGVPQIEKKKVSLFDCISFADESSDVLSSHQGSSILDTDSKKTSTEQNNEIASTSSTSSVDHVNQSKDASILTGSVPFPSVSYEQVVEKPPMDLFKDIFQTSSSEDSEKESDSESVEKSTVTTSQVPVEVQTTSTMKVQVDNSNKDVPNVEKKGFGVFANLDLDALNKRTTNTKSVNSTLPTPTISNAVQQDNTLESNNKEQTNEEKNKSTDTHIEDFYGPAPPPSGIIAPVSLVKWKSSTHAKHKHKHKHKNKKKRKKEKKKHSKRQKSSDSSESEDDVSEQDIIEKLKELRKTQLK